MTRLSWAILLSNSHITARSAPTPVASLLRPPSPPGVATEAGPPVTRTELTNALEQSRQPPPPATEATLVVTLTLSETPTGRPTLWTWGWTCRLTVTRESMRARRAKIHSKRAPRGHTAHERSAGNKSEGFEGVHEQGIELANGIKSYSCDLLLYYNIKP